MAVLVTGGSGYLGQFVVEDLARDFKVGYTYLSSHPPPFTGDVHALKVDLASGEGLREAVASLGRVALVVNCAALSQPVVCEREPDTARAINVPDKLLQVLEAQKQATGLEASLIHISTDQVYNGSRSHWKETDACNPVNMYGRTKLDAEMAVQEGWPRSVVLRSSIIYGPEPPVQPVNRGLFLQFIDRALGKSERTSFFNDEYRCPVYVKDILKIIRASAAKLDDSSPESALVLNMGGPARMSRVDMATAVADARGYDKECIEAVPAATTDRGVASPADISMDSSLLQKELGVTTTPFAKALAEMGFTTAGG